MPASSEGLVETQLSSTFRISDSVSLGWGPRICISSKFPGASDVVVRGFTDYESLLS